jgi:hypothetical protein
MNKPFGSVYDSTFDEEMEKGRELRADVALLHGKMQEKDANIKKIKVENVKLLKKIILFEESIINYEILNFLYADIARVALNSSDYKCAIKYAHAGIEANKKENDLEGIKVNTIVMLDIACFMKAFKEALQIIEKHPGLAKPEIKELLENSPSLNDSLFRSLVKSPKRPKSLKFCLDDKLMLEEKALIAIMRSMDISRSAALRYTNPTVN